MLLIILNICSVLFLVNRAIFDLKNYNSIIFYYCVCILFFTGIPLLFDSIYIELFGISSLINLLMENNSTLSDYRSISKDILWECSWFILFFNIILLKVYDWIIGKNKPCYQQLNKEDFFPWIYYFIWGILGLIIFIILYGFNIQNAGIDYRSHSTSSLISGKSIVLMNLFANMSIAGLFVALLDKKRIKILLSILPIAVIGFLTESRALLIGGVFMFLYYLIYSYRNNIRKNIIIFVFAGLVCTMLLVGLRRDNIGLLPYPIWRDVSCADLYYSFANHTFLSTHGSNMLRLITTGLPVYKMDYVEDITYLLAEIRYFSGWGSLHPTLFGWIFIDLGWYGLFAAIFFGIFIALMEKIRIALSVKWGYMFLPAEFIFITVLCRGSVQYAYSNVIYIFEFFLFFYFFIKILYLYSSKKYVNCLIE